MHALLADAATRASRYLADIETRPVAPAPAALAALEGFNTPLPENPAAPAETLRLLDELGSPATMGMAGPRFFGFVIGGALPATLAANWLTTAWDQNAVLYRASPGVAFIEQVALRWLLDILHLPPTCGAAAAVVCSEDFARRHGLDARVRIAAQAMTTDGPSTFGSNDMRKLVGADMARAAAAKVYAEAGIGPDDLDVVELHDCFTANELITYESLGLTPEGTAEKFILDGDNTYGGRVVTNPSGGLLSKGHPLGATGLAQCAELTWQLRGQAQQRQVEGARLALQHNLGLGGACVVTLYERMDA